MLLHLFFKQPSVSTIRPEGIRLFSWFIEIIYVAVCYFWWVALLFLDPADALDKLLCVRIFGRIHPTHHASAPLRDLLPASSLSSVATCSHKALLQFPARDLTEYKRQSAGGEHYTVSGLHEVQRTLGSGLEARFSAMVTQVEILQNERLKVVWNTPDNVIHEEIFDQVVLAVAPDIAGRISNPSEKPRHRFQQQRSKALHTVMV